MTMTIKAEDSAHALMNSLLTDERAKAQAVVESCEARIVETLE